jgi:3-oxoacyl-[acyl-carrier protein] reductase
MSNRLDGKTALVTGAASGMGRAIAREFLTEGAKVAFVDINADAVASEVAQHEAKNVLALSGDISQTDDVEKMVAEAITRFGQIDVLVNCAGILDGYATVLETSDELWDRVMRINLKGAFLVSRAVLDNMVANGAGSIVNIASIAGLVAGGGGAAYTAAKHGIVGLTRQTTYDFGKAGVRANAICPGAIETAMTREILDSGDAAVMDIIRSVPAGRHGQPEEVAKLALYLASDESAFVQGSVIAIDGGWTVR